MKTIVEIEGEKFLINGRPTYEGRSFEGKSVEGLLFNSRMVQAIFDDENPETRKLWAYPDTGKWDAQRNTDEFCAALPLYRQHGLLGVTVGMQGGGSIYTPEIYDQYLCSAFEPDGTFRPAYFKRLEQVIKAADDCGMVVIVNYFYWKQAARMVGDGVIEATTERMSDWLLAGGYRNIVIDVVNEAGVGKGLNPLLTPEGVDRLVEIVQQTSLDGRRLLVGASSGGCDALPRGRWAELEDISMPHGNWCSATELAAKLRQFKASSVYQKRPRPVMVNEDTVFLDNLDAAFAEGCSWGFYHQGYGSDYRDRTDWRTQPREKDFEKLSGYQTLPINWGINDETKRAFFNRVAEITGENPSSGGAF
jgi:hypothetical protein